MQAEDLEVELSPLDTALHRLGMLATTTDSRKQFLQEKRSNQLKTLKINTRYVSNVSIGFRVRPLTPHVRYKPYAIRHRTRSENNEDGGLVKAVVDDILEESVDLAQLKKAKSLESVVAEGEQGVDVVSNCIQNLKVV